MVKSEDFIMEIHRTAVRIPIPNDYQINEVDSYDCLGSKFSKTFNHDCEHDNNFNHQKVKQIDKPIAWFIVLSIRIVFIML